MYVYTYMYSNIYLPTKQYLSTLLFMLYMVVSPSSNQHLLFPNMEELSHLNILHVRRRRRKRSQLRFTEQEQTTYRGRKE